MIKPDAVQRNLAGEIICRVLRKGYKICAMKMLRIDHDLASEHYVEHSSKPFFGSLVSFVTSGPVIAIVLEGDGVIEGIRRLMGSTDPKKADPGTIRADLGIDMARNVVHGSDSTASAKREISLFFEKNEVIDFARCDEGWLYP